MHGWEEVADDVHQRRYEPMGIRVCVVIRAVHAAGVTSEDAEAEVAERWPFPSDHVTLAVAGGYRQLDGCRQARTPVGGGH